MTCWICSICCSSFSAARVIRLKCDLAEVFGWSVIWLKCVSSLASLAASFNCSHRVPHHHHLHWLLPVPFEATLTSTCAVWGHIIIYLCRSRPHWLLPVPFEATLPSTCAVWGHIIIYLCRLRPHWLLLVDTAWYILYNSMESHFRTIRNELARWTPKLMSGVDAFHSCAPERCSWGSSALHIAPEYSNINIYIYICIYEAALSHHVVSMCTHSAHQQTPDLYV